MGKDEKASDAFSRVYEDDQWNGGSGVGSRADLNDDYRGLVGRMIASGDVSSVVDAGCGDWQFSRFIDWTGVDYQGFDVVESVVGENRRVYTKDNVSFAVRDFSREVLPSADLLLCKDVLQHWPVAKVSEFLARNSGRFRYIVATNDVWSVYSPTGSLNSEIDFGEWRTIDLAKAPFSQNIRKYVEFDYVGEWTKRSVLLCSLPTKLAGSLNKNSGYARFS